MAEILSTIAEYPVARLVYSSLGFYGRARGGELPGMWFTEALAPIGASSAAVRKALRRMETGGELQVRRTGRHKIYRLSAYGRAAVDAGAERLRGYQAGPWSGHWTMVYTQFDAASRSARDRARSVLQVEGFASLGPAVFIHPRARASRLLEALAADGLAGHATVVRGPLSGSAPRDLIGLWDTDRLAERYRAFTARYEPTLDANFDRRWAGRRGFALKFAVVLDALAIAWRDPDLPPELLPPRWPGTRARALATSLNRSLLPIATRYADGVLARVREASPDLDMPAIPTLTAPAPIEAR